MIKNYFRILKKPHAHLQTILKTPVKFQKDLTKTVGGVKGKKYLLKIQNHAPRTTENQKQCPSAFSSKRRGTKIDFQGGHLGFPIGMILAVLIYMSPQCFLPNFKSVGLSMQKKK